VNHDGLLDMVVSLNKFGVGLLINTGTGFAMQPVTSLWQDELEVGDVTGDGLLDVVGLRSGPNNLLTVFPQTPDGTFGGPVYYDIDEVFVDGLEVADVTNDGWPDQTRALEEDRPCAHAKATSRGEET
jgi:hypothetical protein